MENIQLICFIEQNGYDAFTLNMGVFKHVSLMQTCIVNATALMSIMIFKDKTTFVLHRFNIASKIKNWKRPFVFYSAGHNAFHTFDWSK